MLQATYAKMKSKYILFCMNMN